MDTYFDLGGYIFPVTTQSTEIHVEVAARLTAPAHQ